VLPLSEHRVLVVARDRQVGISIADNLATENFEIRGPVIDDECMALLRTYSGRGIPVCVMVVEQELAIALGIVNSVRGLAGVECVVLARELLPEDVATLLDAGAADVVRLDLARIELAARVRRCIASAASGAGALIAAGHLHIDVARRQVRSENRNLNLTRTEFDLLVCLARRANRVVAAGEILREALGYARDSDTHVLTVHIQRLRTKVEPDPRQPTLITSVRGIGYMLVSE
jgi:two-component system response regulator MtrA